MLLLIALQKLAASSIAALTRRRDMLARTILGGLPAEDPEAETMDEAAEAEESRPGEVTVLLMKDEIARLDEIIGYAREIEGETKVATLVELIEARLVPDEPLLLFTEYKATQALGHLDFFQFSAPFLGATGLKLAGDR